MNIDPAAPQRRLLVVDDDRDLVDSLCEWFALSTDWSVAGAYGPADALAQAARTPPDAILLDMEMDGVDGFDTARRLESVTGQSPSRLLALTGNERLREAAARDARFAGSVMKPANLDSLLHLLDSMPLRH